MRREGEVECLNEGEKCRGVSQMDVGERRPQHQVCEGGASAKQ